MAWHSPTPRLCAKFALLRQSTSTRRAGWPAPARRRPARWPARAAGTPGRRTSDLAVTPARPRREYRLPDPPAPAAKKIPAPRGPALGHTHRGIGVPAAPRIPRGSARDTVSTEIGRFVLDRPWRASRNLGKPQTIFRQADQLPHAHGFGLRHPLAQRRDPVIAAALVVQVRVGPLVGFFDQPLLQHLVDGAVQRAGAQIELAAGALQDLALQRIAVAFALTERQQHVEDGGPQSLAAGGTGPPAGARSIAPGTSSNAMSRSVTRVRSAVWSSQVSPLIFGNSVFTWT